MKTIFQFNLFRGMLTALIVLFFCAAGWAQQGASISLKDVVIPNNVSVNSQITITGKFKNNGATPFSGSLGLHLQVKDDMNSGAGHYYSSEIQSVGYFNLQPGQEATFTTTVNVVPSLFKASKDIIIIYPKVGNEFAPSNPSFEKEVNIN